MIGVFGFGIHSKKTPIPAIQEITKDSIAFYNKINNFKLTEDGRLPYAYGVSNSSYFVDYVDTVFYVSKKNLPYFFIGMSKSISGITDKNKSYHAGIDYGSVIGNALSLIEKDYYGKMSIDAKKMYIKGLFAKDSNLSEEEVKKVISAVSEKVKEKGYAKNRGESETFMLRKSQEEGVKKLPGGTLYKVIKDGNGKNPREEQTVIIEYCMNSIDGTEIDNSRSQNNGSIKVKVQLLIRGYSDALTHMKEGSEWELFIPYDQAYGSKWNGQIPPYSALISRVKLIKIADNAVHQAKSSRSNSSGEWQRPSVKHTCTNCMGTGIYVWPSGNRDRCLACDGKGYTLNYW